MMNKILLTLLLVFCIQLLTNAQQGFEYIKFSKCEITSDSSEKKDAFAINLVLSFDKSLNKLFISGDITTSITLKEFIKISSDGNGYYGRIFKALNNDGTECAISFIYNSDNKPFCFYSRNFVLGKYVDTFYKN